jgi:hypothetical protein
MTSLKECSRETFYDCTRDERSNKVEILTIIIQIQREHSPREEQFLKFDELKKVKHGIVAIGCKVIGHKITSSLCIRPEQNIFRNFVHIFWTPFLPTFLHCKDTVPKIWKKIFPDWKFRGLSQFLHSYICERFIYSHDRSAAGKRVDRSWHYINRLQRYECSNWDWGRAVWFLGIHKMDLLCSLVYQVNFPVFSSCQFFLQNQKLSLTIPYMTTWFLHKQLLKS